MTTGTKSSPGMYPSASSGFYKTWSGADGKYLGDGRTRWNDYQMTYYWEGPQTGQTANKVSTTSSADLGWSLRDDMLLENKLVDAVRGHQFNLAVNVAQGKQLVNMVSNNIQKFGRALLYLKRGNFASAARTLGVRRRDTKLKDKDISGRWLELQYGWLPALGDSYEAAKAFEALQEGRKSTVRVTHGVTKPIEGSAAPSEYQCPGISEVFGTIEYEMLEEISFARSLGLTDPFSVAWEIIPFSFVIDWFYPIGTFLDNLAVLPSLKGRFRKTIYRKQACSYASGKPAYAGTKRSGLHVYVKRTCTTGLFPTRPEFRLDGALKGKRIFNAIALAHTLLRKG